MFGWWKRNRRRKLRRKPFNPEWRELIDANFEIFGCLAKAQQDELINHVKVFLAEKNFEGCGGLELTDEMKVIIAAQACLLLMHRHTDYYSRLRSILVYPSSYMGISNDPQDAEEGEHRLGESWDTGVVVLAWDAVLSGAHNVADGHNLVFHEFSHQLDQEDGLADGLPVLNEKGDSFIDRRGKYSAWAQVFSREFKQHVEHTRRGKRTVLDEYGATNPAEYFSVATECFFEKPVSLKKKHPHLYRELKKFYKLDPASWRTRRYRVNRE
ncbi:MAG: zinc-dependent peptidase [Limisphaerales bacterium]